MKSNSYNRLARFYDFLSFLVFGETIKKSQGHFIQSISPNASVLIVGDGTGYFLYNLLKENHKGIIVSVESSAEMVRLTKKRIAKLPNIENVKILESKVEELNLTETFDVVVTNFFLDQFEDEKLSSIIKHLYSLLNNNGSWIFTDFKINEKGLNKYWQGLLIKAMYLFFKITTNISNKQLLNFDKHFQNIGMIKSNSRLFFHGMIETAVYKKVL